MPPRIEREYPIVEAKRQLKVSLKDLANDAKRYDKGDFDAINRSSATLRTIFYHNNRNKSLVQFLNLENKLHMFSFAPQRKAKSVANYGDIYFARFKQPNVLTNNPEYRNMFIFNPFNDKPRNLSFSQWWQEPIIYFDSSNLTREFLILAAANADGAAHFDEKYKEAFKDYVNFKNGYTGYRIRPGTSPIVFSELIGSSYDPSKEIVIRDLPLAVLREVVHETILSFQKLHNYYINYKPDFDYNWQRKTNYIGWHLNFERTK